MKNGKWLRAGILSSSLALAGALLAGAPAGASPPEPGFGLVGFQQTNVPTSGIGAGETVIAGLTFPFAVAGEVNRGRYIEFTVSLRPQGTTAVTVDAFIDVTGTVPPVSTVRVAGSSAYLPVATGAGAETMIVHGFQRLEPGEYVATVKVGRTTGTGDVTVQQTAGASQSLLIEDIGQCC